MTVIDDLIFDRRQTDVADYYRLLAEVKKSSAPMAVLQEWAVDHKATYNASDLNRIGEAIQYVANEFNASGYIVTVNPKRDWAAADTPTAAQIEHILEELRLLRGILGVASLPVPPVNMVKMTYQKANAIEELLYQLDRQLFLIIYGSWYSGEIYSGEV